MQHFLYYLSYCLFHLEYQLLFLYYFIIKKDKITLVFLFFLLSVTISYKKIEKNLKSVCDFLSSFNKNELSYRFSELNTFLSSNPYTSTCWEDCKKALIFPEKLYTAVKQSTASVSSASDVYLTVDAAYFFNEDTLINSKINYKYF